MRIALLWLVLWLSLVAVQAQQTAPDFVEAVVDRTTAYVGQPIVYTWRWYLAMSNADGSESNSAIERPNFDGFGQETLDVFTESAIREGQTYQVITQQVVLYPYSAGTYTLEPLRITVAETPFTAGKTLESTPIQLVILSLPANAPPTFGNGVGQFDVVAQIDRQEGATGTPFTYTMTITGSGNGPLLTAPVLTFGPEWRVYTGESRTRRDGPLLSEHVFTWTLIPLQPGTLAISAQAWSFLNPQTGQYETRATQPLVVNVSGEAIAVPLVSAAPATPTLYPLRANDTGISVAGTPRRAVDGLGLLYAIAVPGVAALLWVWRTRYSKREQTVRPARKTRTRFDERLAALAQAAPPQVVAEVQEILRDVVSRKYRIAAATSETLDALPIPTEVKDELRAIFDLAETVRYAPFSAEDTERLLRDTARLIRTLEAL